MATPSVGSTGRAADDLTRWRRFLGRLGLRPRADSNPQQHQPPHVRLSEPRDRTSATDAAQDPEVIDRSRPSEAQLGLIGLRFSQLGIRRVEPRLQFAADTVRRPLVRMSEMTMAEASTLIDTLEAVAGTGNADRTQGPSGLAEQPCSAAQLRTLHMLWKATHPMGGSSRDSRAADRVRRLEWVSTTLQRPIGSFKELTRAEAVEAIDELLPDDHVGNLGDLGHGR
jgi:hypothetical protein